MDKLTIFWFRRDLRLFDNHGLFKALQSGNVLPVFIFDSEILNKLQNKNDLRINFIRAELKSLKEQLAELKSKMEKPILKGKIENMNETIQKSKPEDTFTGPLDLV